MIEAGVEDLLRGASLRVTGPRVAVLSAIRQHPHVDAGTIVDLVRERIGAVSTQAVYDVLKALVAAGLARRIDLPNSPARYEGQIGDDHQHLVCRSCGRISDIARPRMSAAPKPPHDQGFAIDGVEVTYWGLCPDCQAAGAIDRQSSATTG
jgi:Fur family ferric uptake transcriptional regulator